MFNEKSLRDAIVEKWGPAGAHIDVFDEMLTDRKRMKLGINKAINMILDIDGQGVIEVARHLQSLHKSRLAVELKKNPNPKPKSAADFIKQKPTCSRCKGTKQIPGTTKICPYCTGILKKG